MTNRGIVIIMHLINGERVGWDEIINSGDAGALWVFLREAKGYCWDVEPDPAKPNRVWYYWFYKGGS